MNYQNQYIESIQHSIAEQTFVKLVLSNYKGVFEKLKSCHIKKIATKQDIKLSFTYRYQTKDIIKNYPIDEAISLISDFVITEEFKNSILYTTEFDLLYDASIKNKMLLKKIKATYSTLPSLDHNTHKNRLIVADGKSYLQKLKITDEKGNVIPNAQDKYKQINHYIELLSPLINNLPKSKSLNVLDMGAGKGYLTFALYDYLTNVLKLNVDVVGVEYRKDLVNLCNDIALKSKFNNLKFEEGTILDYNIESINVLIALHACDTATDDAIYKGIKCNADLIVVAPCCHKQIRREIEKYKIKNELDVLLKHGIFLERQSEMITDGLRSLILEYFDYSTKVFQFISDVHTPKNVMIVAEKKIKTDSQKKEILEKINNLKSYFGIGYHHLEKLIGL